MNFLERNAQEANNYFSFNPYSKLYWHNMLLFFNRSILAPKVLQTVGQAKLRSQWKVTQPIQAGYLGTLTVHAPAKNVTGRGRFEFDLLVQSDAKQSRLALSEIRVWEDTSPGTTRWIFKIRVNGADAIAVPLSRYEDEGKPTRYLVRRAAIPLPPGGPLVLEVEGLKP
jgi:hypothetical protein